MPDAFPSGNGRPGGDFAFRINAVPGDATRDGVVNALDLSFVKQRLARRATDPSPGNASAFSPFADLSAEGQITALDVAALKQRLSTRLPAAAAPVIVVAGALFSSGPIDPHKNTALVLASCAPPLPVLKGRGQG